LHQLMLLAMFGIGHCGSSARIAAKSDHLRGMLQQ
jgi:hypothetical protein